MSYPARFYYDPFSAFDRLFEDAFVPRCHPSSAVVERGRNSGNESQLLLRPKYVLNRGSSDIVLTYIYRMDLHENKEANTVTAVFELPGLKSQDVSIEVHQGRLTVSGEFDKTESREEGGYAVRERHHGKFARTIQVPVGVQVRFACYPRGFLY